MKPFAACVAALMVLFSDACHLPPPSTPSASTRSTPAARALHRLFARAWEARLRENPLFATRTGDRRFNHLLSAVRPADYQRRLTRRRDLLAELSRIAPADLSESDRLNREVFLRIQRNRVREIELRAHLMPITARGGFHLSFVQLPRRVPLRTVADYDDYLARLRAFSGWVGQHIELMQEGLRRGMIPPRVVLKGAFKPIRAFIATDPTRSRLYAPFRKLPTRFDIASRKRLQAEARQAIRTSVVPGYQKLLSFLRQEYLPRARGTIAASALPDGRAFYAHRVRRFTTLPLTATTVHQRGLAEVARIRAEMAAVIRKTGFTGDFAAFLRFLRTDPRFYAKTPRALLERTAYILKRMDGQLPRLFKVLPRTPYGIRRVPAFLAPGAPTAYYWPPAGDGTRGGFYFVNVHDLKSRPLYEIEALSLHEAVPGHHLQIALQQELRNLPRFRQFAGFGAFVEGWGLYAERLGLEVGFYRDPYSNFGRLTYEMWRACRLVVDTGIHALGWSRQRAIDFMARNSALSLHNIATEVDRYIAWPGQALGYKIGELKLRELRALAERRLGSAFDVRDFHRVVLGVGALPLDLLETRLRAWLKRASSRAN